MNPAQIMKSVLSPSIQSDSLGQSFKAGQIVTGKITKLFPNQTAEVQIGSQKVIAQLEAPLSTNERYWFQIQPGEGKIHLKVLNGLTGAALRGNAGVEDLLAQFGLQSTKENNALIRFMIKEQLPITKDSLQLASVWLKGFEPLADGLATIKLMVEKAVPFTKDIFLSLLATQQKVPFHELISNLNKELTKAAPTDQILNLQSKLTELTLPLGERIGKLALPQLVKSWLSSSGKEESSAIDFLKKIGLVQESASEGELIRKVLMTLNERKGSFHINDGSENLSGKLKTIIEKSGVSVSAHLPSVLTDSPESMNGIKYSGLPKLTETVKSALTTLLMEKSVLERNTTAQNPPGYRTAIEILSLLGNNNTSIQTAEKMLGKLLSGRLNSGDKQVTLPNEKEIVEIDRILKSISAETVNWSEGPSVYKEIKKVLSSLGYEYESDMNAFGFKENEKLNETLKPMLIKYLNEHPSHSGREAAENLLNRITGVQLLNNDTSILQQVVMQMPLTFVEKKFDLTIQWSGKKKEDGKIDPNYCRILFYLELEQIGHTIVDMQVQNRILSIGILNENPDLKTIASPLIAPLKEKLAEMKYVLSSISFEQPSLNGGKSLLREKIRAYDSKGYSGVDIRI
ncbi:MULTISPECIES: hypothetical protein [unclassified Bacillus (in: firmicutes)]|uniref:hypothetical protein n=1 Tax=unclassified Bacillus (in: firmicutes) TaxID=185979 RepID=UPI0008E9551E|nr:MULTISPECIES: hypothetical protein [unclassified Bacillus (in: firmicutes)]SFA74289.1 hypothetical protein SAMN02799634_101433 [Bacillus sp. UNCCL13]SFQ64523.1 hypothetical protein SAMN04488577_0712 [Bacillus sp. cl95]